MKLQVNQHRLKQRASRKSPGRNRELVEKRRSNLMGTKALKTEETRAGRTVAGIVNSIETLEGGGFVVHRPFPKSSFSEFDPFLLLDERGRMNVAPGEAKGAPDHPHRGFETVTYILSGEMEHKDSQGHTGKLRPGDVQWMTAGAGVVNSES